MSKTDVEKDFSLKKEKKRERERERELHGTLRYHHRPRQFRVAISNDDRIE